MEARQQAAEMEVQVAPLRMRVERLVKESAAQQQHAAWLETQLADKTKAIQDLRQRVSQSTQELETLRSQHADEAASLKKQLESSRQTVRKLEAALVHSKEQVKEVMAAGMHQEEQFQNELSAQRRLAELYKEAAEDGNARVEELQGLTEALRKALAESEAAVADISERTKEQVEHIFREQAEGAEQRMEALQQELKEAREKMAELERSKVAQWQEASTVAEISSAAAKAHLEAHNLTPKQMLDQMIELETALQGERDEKGRLQVYLDRMVKEVEEKAPMIISLKMEHERAVASHAQVSERLEACMHELTKYRSRGNQALKEKVEIEKKCEALTHNVEDLSRQVQHLLFRSHEQQHGHTAPGEVASENLVVFKDVEEMQVRNQQLLMVIRELSASKKSKNLARDDGDATTTNLIAATESDDESESSEDSEISRRLATAHREIDELRAEREEERQMIAAIVKQRDMYRVLLAQADNKFLGGGAGGGSARSGPMDSDIGSPRAHRSSTGVSDSIALRELRKEFEQYKKEKQANVKMLQESMDKTRAESSQLRLMQMQAQVDAKCNLDRYEASEKRRHDGDDEIVRLRAKTEHLNSLLIQHQQLVADTEAKLDTAVARARAFEMEKESATREVIFFKTHEEKMLQELASLRLDNTNLLKLMETTRQIEASREEREHHENERLAARVVSLEKKLQEAYEKVQGSEAMHGTKTVAAEQAKDMAVGELEKIKTMYATTKEELIRLEEQKKALEEKSILLEKEVTHMREQLRKGVSTAAAERVATLETQLRDAQLEIQSSTELKKSLTEAVAKYKTIAEANEKSLNELSAASEKWKTGQEEKLKMLEEQKTAIAAQLERARAEIKDHVSEGNKWREDADRMEQEHQSLLHQSLEKQRAYQLEAEAAQKELAMMREEYEKLHTDVLVAQENYERELKTHASQLETFAASRKALEEQQRKHRELLAEVAELRSRVSAGEHESESKVYSMQKQLEDALEAKTGLMEQNKLLHTQLERTGHQLRQALESSMMKSAATNGSGNTDQSKDIEHSKEIGDLQSVISFLRKEGEVATSKVELVQQENQRLRMQISTMETTTQALREDIKRLEDAASTSVGKNGVFNTAVSSKPDKREVEQMNLLRESNAALRDESQKNLARWKEETARVEVLQAQLAPLQASEMQLKSQIESLQQEISLLNEANKRWKNRVEQLVDKYQQVDPVEYEKVCKEKAELEKQVTEAREKEATLRVEVEALKSNEGNALDEERKKAEILRKQYEQIRSFAKTWKSRASALTTQLEERTKEVEAKSASVTELETKIVALEAATAEAGGAGAAATANWEKERRSLLARVETESGMVSKYKEISSKAFSTAKMLQQENLQLKQQLSTKVDEAVTEATPPQQSEKASEEPAAVPTGVDSVFPPLPPPLPAQSPPPSETATPQADADVDMEGKPADVTEPAKESTTTKAADQPPTSAPLPQAPVTALPTLKTVNPPLPAASSGTSTVASATKPAPATVPGTFTFQKLPMPPSTVAPAAPKAESKELDEEEKMRQLLLTMKQKKAKKAQASPQTTTPTKPAVILRSNVSTPTPTPTSQAQNEQPQQQTAVGTQFGEMFKIGSSGASSLVFGRPGITRPVPTSPTPPSTQTVTSVEETSTSDSVTNSAIVQSTSGTEAQRRSNRLQRFGIAAAAPMTGSPAAPSTVLLKRPAGPTGEVQLPVKLPKLEETPSPAQAPSATTTTDISSVQVSEEQIVIEEETKTAEGDEAL